MFTTTNAIRPRAVAAVATFALLFGAARARAEDSNRSDVRANLEKDGWRVIWGKNFTEADWVRGTKAIAESVAAENPGPFLAWFEQALDENFTLIERNLKGVTRQDLERWLVQSLRERRIITYKGLELDAGFATYNRWQRIVYDEPRTRQKKVSDPFGIGWTYVPEYYTERVEKKVPLPNWNQFYIRYRLIPDGANTGGGGGGRGGGGGHVPSTSTIEVNFKNSTPYRVNFYLNGGTGLNTSIEPGQTRRYKMVVDAGVPPVVGINQLDGTRLPFSVANGGSYEFRMQGKEIRNFYR